MVKAKKALGQNFLVDSNVVRDLVEAAGVWGRDTVLEVGAGTGAVTQELAKRAQKVIAVEFDRDLIPTLKENLKEFKNVEILNEDILQLNPLLYSPVTKIVGSIPYHITSPLIHKILHLEKRPESITFVVQKEVAEKICAEPPKGTYLSNFVKNFGNARIGRAIKPHAFAPPPKVGSTILHIDLREPTVKEAKKFEKFLHEGFSHPRKMIKNRFPLKTLEEVGIDPKARPGNLSFHEWKSIYQKIKARG
ncbi:ribosomal RNA small subunit methyltransferase A [Candidatus Saccharibacteria bacterium]|nr:ribosomal RNA small subunit methyltransferase A [Candidatus Saccharibacteria bacterium]